MIVINCDDPTARANVTAAFQLQIIWCITNMLDY